MRSTRNIRRTSDEQLASMRDALSQLMDNQWFIAPRLLTDLCVMQEEIEAERAARVGRPEHGDVSLGTNVTS